MTDDVAGRLGDKLRDAAREEAIVSQDRPVVDSQRPEELPLDLWLWS